MTPEIQLIFNVGYGVGMLLLGWVLNSLRDSIKSLHDSDTALAIKVQSIEVLVAGTYIKRTEFDHAIEKLGLVLFEKLDKIETKLDSKADKTTCSSIHKGDRA